jgi:hypothetical protein
MPDHDAVLVGRLAAHQVPAVNTYVDLRTELVSLVITMTVEVSGERNG